MKILVPLDGSKLSETVLPYVTLLPEGQGHEVHLLRVAELPRPEVVVPAWSYGVFDYYLDVEPRTGEGKAQTAARAKTEDAIAKVEAALTDYLVEKAKGLPGLEVKCRAILGGPPDHEIIRYAEAIGADLIAMATHGHTGLAELVLGSVAHAVLHHSTVPVFLVKPHGKEKVTPESLELNKVIVPLDGSDQAEAVLPYAEELAKTFKAQVVLVQVLPLQPYAPALGVDIMETGYLSGLAQQLRSKGIEAQWEVLHDRKPGDAIVEFARWTPQAVIAMMTRNRPPIAEALLGSVSHAVLGSSVAPVLLVRPKHAAH